MGTSTSVWQPTDDYMIQFASCRFKLSTDLPIQIYHQTPLLACMLLCCVHPGTRPPLSRPEADAGLVVWWNEG